MLARDARVRTRAEFDRIFHDGRAAHGERLSVRAASDEGPARVGFIVGKRVSAKATARNRLKRQLRGIVRDRYPDLAAETLTAVIAKPEALDAETSELADEFERLARKVQLIR